MAVSFIFINYFTKNRFLKKKKKKRLTKIDSAASSGGKGNLTYFTYIPWRPLEAALSISTFRFLFTRCL
jgi:hypothetical protein